MEFTSNLLKIRLKSKCLTVNTVVILNLISLLYFIIFINTVIPRFWQLIGAVKTCCQNPTIRG